MGSSKDFADIHIQSRSGCDIKWVILKDLVFKRFLEFEIADKGLGIQINTLNSYHIKNEETGLNSNYLSSHSLRPTRELTVKVPVLVHGPCGYLWGQLFLLKETRAHCGQCDPHSSTYIHANRLRPQEWVHYKLAWRKLWVSWRWHQVELNW